MHWVTLNIAGHALMMRLTDASIRALVLAGLAFLVITLLRRNASAEHTVWTLVLAGMLALPFLRPVIPETRVPLPRILANATSTTAPVRSNVTPYREPAPVVVSDTAHHFRLWLWIMGVYFAGVAILGARLVGGWILTRRALRSTRTIHPAMPEYFDRITYIQPEVILKESDFVPVPLTTGLLRMHVILPADWRRWSRAKLNAVLTHELAHASRRDPFVAFLAAINTCLFWFHPLAWWLRRRLAVLAEHAADDAVLASEVDRESYARLLLECSARLGPGSSRSIWHSAAMSGPVVAQRIRRVLDVRTLEQLKPLTKPGRTMLLSAGALLIWFSTTVDVRTLAASQPGPVHFPGAMTREQAIALEKDLAANPEDESARAKLLRYYFFSPSPSPFAQTTDRRQMEDRRIPLVLWLIDHHPESTLHQEPVAVIWPNFDGDNVAQEARSLWRTEVNLHPDDPRVLANAARQDDDIAERLDLMQRAQKLDPAHQTEPLARIYSQILLWNNETGTRSPMKDGGLASQVRYDLATSTNIALVGSVARHFIEGAATEALDPRGRWDFSQVRALATELITRAQSLDPGNRAWADLMEGVDELPSD